MSKSYWFKQAKEHNDIKRDYIKDLQEFKACGNIAAVRFCAKCINHHNNAAKECIEIAKTFAK